MDEDGLCAVMRGDTFGRDITVSRAVSEQSANRASSDDCNVDCNGSRTDKGNITLHLKIKVMATPNGSIPVFNLGPDFVISVQSDTAYRVDNDGSFADDKSINQCLTSVQDTPRRLYRSDMRISPSPVKQRLFPDSPESDESQHSDGEDDDDQVYQTSLYDMTMGIADLREWDRILEDSDQLKTTNNNDIEPDRGESCCDDLSIQDVFQSDSDEDKENMPPGPSDGKIRVIRASERAALRETTVIHWPTSLLNDGEIGGRIPEKKCKISASPRGVVMIPKRDERMRKILHESVSRIPIRKHQPAENGPVSGTDELSPGSAANFLKTPTMSTKSPKRSAQISPISHKSPSIGSASRSMSQTKTRPSPARSIKSVVSAMEKSKASSEPRRPSYDMTSFSLATPTRRPYRTTSGSISGFDFSRPGYANESAQVNAAEATSLFSGGEQGDRSFLASSLHSRHDGGGLEIDQREEQLGSIRGCQHAGIYGLDPFVSSSIWRSEEHRDFHSPLGRLSDDFLRLPSPSPSSKLSFPWHSGASIARRRMSATPVEEPRKPVLEIVAGILTIRFPESAKAEMLMYEAKVSLRLKNSTAEDWHSINIGIPRAGLERPPGLKSQAEFGQLNVNTGDTKIILMVSPPQVCLGTVDGWEDSMDRSRLVTISPRPPQESDLEYIGNSPRQEWLTETIETLWCRLDSIPVQVAFEAATSWCDRKLGGCIKFLKQLACALGLNEMVQSPGQALKRALAQSFALLFTALVIGELFYSDSSGRPSLHSSRDVKSPKIESAFIPRDPPTCSAEWVLRKRGRQGDMCQNVWASRPSSQSEPKAKLAIADTPMISGMPAERRPVIEKAVPTTMSIPESPQGDEVLHGEASDKILIDKPASNKEKKKETIRDQIDRFLGWKGPLEI